MSVKEVLLPQDATIETAFDATFKYAGLEPDSKSTVAPPAVAIISLPLDLIRVGLAFHANITSDHFLALAGSSAHALLDVDNKNYESHGLMIMAGEQISSMVLAFASRLAQETGASSVRSVGINADPRMPYTAFYQSHDNSYKRGLLALTPDFIQLCKDYPADALLMIAGIASHLKDYHRGRVRKDELDWAERDSTLLTPMAKRMHAHRAAFLVYAANESPNTEFKYYDQQVSERKLSPSLGDLRKLYPKGVFSLPESIRYE